MWCASTVNSLSFAFFDICQWYETTCIIRSTKSILSGAKHKLGKAGTLNLTYQVIDIKQNSQVTYLGCILNETMSSEPMAYKIIKKINSRLNFLFRKTFFDQASDSSCATHWFSRILIMHALYGILIFTKNWKINAFDFASILIKWFKYCKLSSKN